MAEVPGNSTTFCWTSLTANLGWNLIRALFQRQAFSSSDVGSSSTGKQGQAAAEVETTATLLQEEAIAARQRPPLSRKPLLRSKGRRHRHAEDGNPRHDRAYWLPGENNEACSGCLATRLLPPSSDSKTSRHQIRQSLPRQGPHSRARPARRVHFKDLRQVRHAEAQSWGKQDIHLQFRGL